MLHFSCKCLKMTIPMLNIWTYSVLNVREIIYNVLEQSESNIEGWKPCKCQWNFKPGSCEIFINNICCLMVCSLLCFGKAQQDLTVGSFVVICITVGDYLPQRDRFTSLSISHSLVCWIEVRLSLSSSEVKYISPPAPVGSQHYSTWTAESEGHVDKLGRS